MPVQRKLAIVSSAVGGVLLSPFVASLALVIGLTLALVDAYEYMLYRIVRPSKRSLHRSGIDVDDAELFRYADDTEFTCLVSHMLPDRNKQSGTIQTIA